METRRILDALCSLGYFVIAYLTYTDYWGYANRSGGEMHDVLVALADQRIVPVLLWLALVHLLSSTSRLRSKNNPEIRVTSVVFFATYLVIAIYASSCQWFGCAVYYPVAILMLLTFGGATLLSIVSIFSRNKKVGEENPL